MAHLNWHLNLGYLDAEGFLPRRTNGKLSPGAMRTLVTSGKENS